MKKHLIKAVDYLLTILDNFGPLIFAVFVILCLVVPVYFDIKLGKDVERNVTNLGCSLVPAHVEHYTRYIEHKVGDHVQSIPVPSTRYVEDEYFISIADQEGLRSLNISLAAFNFYKDRKFVKVSFREGRYTKKHWHEKLVYDQE